MDIAVRYCSKTKFGNTRRIAEAIADGIGVKAVSIADEPSLKDKADILFLGGAPYANIMAPELREYADNLDPAMAWSIWNSGEHLQNKEVILIWQEWRLR